MQIHCSCSEHFQNIHPELVIEKGAASQHKGQTRHQYFRTKSSNYTRNYLFAFFGDIFQYVTDLAAFVRFLTGGERNSFRA